MVLRSLVVAIVYLSFFSLIIYNIYKFLSWSSSTKSENKKLKNQLHINKEQQKLKELIQEKVGEKIKGIKKNRNCFFLI